MTRRIYVGYLILMVTISVAMSSCFKEKPITVPTVTPTGNVYVAHMGAEYRKQIYFNLQSAQFVDSNDKFDYDLSFDCDPLSHHIWVNGAKLMLVVHTGKTDLSAVTIDDTTRQVWHVEYGAGDPNECAIQDWWVNNALVSAREVYILNMGYDVHDKVIGYKKLQIGDMSGSTYQVTYSNMDGSDEHTVQVSKRSNRNRIYLSMDGSTIPKDLEPDYSQWDLVFTQYSVYFPVERLPYKVTGVLTNPTLTSGVFKHRTEAYLLDSTSDFNAIAIKDVSNGKFSSVQDAIGYNWKKYAGGEYTTNSKYNFIIHSEDRFYKLRFLDFYDGTGTKGYPKFEYQELK
jgi:HmuY protein